MTKREVYAVPGNITSRNSFGTNYLIKGAGAKLAQQWQDVAAELPPDIAVCDSLSRRLRARANEAEVKVKSARVGAFPDR